MNRATLPCTIVVWTLASACSQPNPDFDHTQSGDDVGNETLGDSGSTGNEAGTTDAGTSAEAGTADAGTTTAGTTTAGTDTTADATADAGTTTADTGDTGMECVPQLTEPLNPLFGDPSQLNDDCFPDGYKKRIKVYGHSSGNWMVGECSGSCETCSDVIQHPLGAPGLALADILPPPELDPNMPWIGCFNVEVKGMPVVANNACHYRSVTIWDDEGFANPPLFAASRDGVGLTPTAMALLQWMPSVVQPSACPCAQVPADQDCCADSGKIETFLFKVGDSEAFPPPGVAEGVVVGDEEYTFHGQQAQDGVVCDNIMDVSWAMWRPIPAP